MEQTYSKEELLEHAIDIAKLGGEKTLGYFNNTLHVDRKKDHSPVTIADKEAEKTMRNRLGELHPTHGIIGEEFGRTNADSPIQWIFDPIDGTRSFIHGVPLYTTLVGVVVDGNPVAGVIYAPAIGELCEAGRNLGARLNGSSVEVRSCDSLDQVTFLSTDVTHAGEVGLEKAQQQLIHKTRLHRTWGDAYGHMLVATGRADIMFDAELNIWDAAALLPILQEAGGIFSDTNGHQIIDGPNGFSCNKVLYPKILDIFKTA
mgnify:CR=1 FL=1